MPYERGQTLCDCADHGAYCQHDGKPPGGAKCMARDDWYTRLCSLSQCPGPMDPRCCREGCDGGRMTDEDVDNYRGGGV